MRYIDGYVIPVPRKHLAMYRRMAAQSSRIWKEHGALEYLESVGDDLHMPFGTPFPKLVKAKPGEAVVFAWVVYKSRASRDQVNAKVLKDPRIAAMMKKASPFDTKRMTMGGFRAIVDVR